MRRHKVYWDEYSGRFVFDNKVQAIASLSRNKMRHAEIMNRSDNVFLGNNLKLIHSARGIVEGKYNREMDSARLMLKDMVSYKLVLDKVGKRNNADPWHDENLGKYGLGSSYFEVTEQRNISKVEMDPAWRRRQLTKQLLLQRKPLPVVDRTLNTDDLFQSLHRAKSHSADGPMRTQVDASQPRGALKLPPIAAKKPSNLGSDNKSSEGLFVTQTAFHTQQKQR